MYNTLTLLRMKTMLLFAALLTTSLSCQTKSTQEADDELATTAEDTVVNLTKRPGPDAPRSAADRLVRALYFEHRTEENPFRETKDRAVVDQFFAKPTADLIWQSKKPIKARLFFNAPDAAVEKVWVLPANVAGTRAVVLVTFMNSDKPAEIQCEMTQIAGRWRITNMLYPNGEQLTQHLK